MKQPGNDKILSVGLILRSSILLICTLFFSIATYAAVITSATSGNWSTGSTWVGGVVPTTSDDAIIASGHTVTLTSATSNITNLTINSGATLSDGGKRMAVSGNFIINGTYTGTGGSNSKLLFPGPGNITIDGTGTIDNVSRVEMFSNTTKTILATANITFTGVNQEINIGTNNTVINNGIVSLKNITVTDGTSVWVNAANAVLNISEIFTATGTLTATASGNMVNYNGVAQTVFNTLYFHLKLSGSGNKTIGTASLGTLANGILNITGTAKASVTNMNVVVSELKFLDVSQIAGTWGSTSSIATNKNNTYFFVDPPHGYLNVLNSCSIPAAPTGSASQSFCSGASPTVANLMATGSGIKWYAASSGGSALSTSTALVNGTHYYASQTISNCESISRFDVTVTINASPSISGTTPASRCGTGTVILGATASAGTINWFAASTGGSSLGVGISFTTASISSTTTYWVDATNNGCTTATRTAVIATINAIPTITGTTPGSNCGTGTVNLGATASAGTINWYAAATGGSSLGSGTSYTTASIASTTIYYVDATANGCTTASRTAVTATINAIPTITGTTPASRCSTGTVNLGATASAGTINWYAAATGGSSLGTGTVFTSPSISSTTIYYADATANGCTTASRTAVTATVNALPVITGTTFVCVSSTTQLSGSGTPAASNAWISSATSIATVSATGLVTGVSAGSSNITYTNNLGCSIIASVTVNPLPSASISYPTSPFCSGSGNATVSLSGTSGGSFSSTAGLDINAASGTINVSASTNGSYTVTYTVAAAGGCAQYQTTTSVSIVTAGTWTGTISRAWNNGGNWLCGQVPTNTTNVTIPSGTSYSPLVSTGDAYTKDLTIQEGATLTVDGRDLIIVGTVSNAGLLDMSNGKLTFDGLTAQTIPVNAGGTNTINDLVISNAAGVNMAGPIAITNSLTIANGSLNTGDQLTLKSTATRTARIAELPVDGSGVATAFINGKVTVERYIPARKAWRLLSAPVFSGGAPSISAAWQEGVTTASASPNINPGYGVFIQGGTVANGFDQGATSTPSIKYYSNTANNFLALPATPGTNAAITSYPGYFVYIRGDRGINLLAGNAAATTTATLRIKGNMNSGNITSAVNAVNYTVLGNPYASAIDFGTISRTNVKNSFYVWDPKLSGTFGLGAYVTFSWNSGTSSYDATSAASPLSQYIQSGEAIIIESADGVNPGSVTIKESDKTASGADQVFGFYNGPSQKLRVNLLAVNADASTSLLDGVLTTYADHNSNNIDNDDAKKLNGGSENIGIKRGSTMLSIERRATVTDKDTTFLNLYQMKIGSYKLEITADNLDANNTVAILKDSYSGAINNTVLNPNGTSIIPFSINYDPGSYAIGRFSIVFTSDPGIVLPVTFKTVKASRQQKAILVEWAVENELNLKHYEVERSLDGQNFGKINTTAATAVNGGNAAYKFTDNSPFNGLNYYRIRSVDLDGKIGYSSIVKVAMQVEKSDAAIVVFPNPVTGKTIAMQLNNLANGIYTLQLFNNVGQLVATKTIQQNGSGSVESFEVKENFAAGKYELILKGEGIQLNTPVIKR